jgi:hypothetical protein
MLDHELANYQTAPLKPEAFQLGFPGGSTNRNLMSAVSTIPRDRNGSSMRK